MTMNVGEVGILQNMQECQPCHDGMLAEVMQVIQEGEITILTTIDDEKQKFIAKDNDFYLVKSLSYLFGTKAIIYSHQIRPIEDPDNKELYDEKCETIS